MEKGDSRERKGEEGPGRKQEEKGEEGRWEKKCEDLPGRREQAKVVSQFLPFPHQIRIGCGFQDPSIYTQGHFCLSWKEQPYLVSNFVKLGHPTFFLHYKFGAFSVEYTRFRGKFLFPLWLF